MTDALKSKLKTLPASPGVYFHKDKNGEVIYVGKAAVLKNRVRQYFQNGPKDPKTTRLVAEIVDTDWIVVDTEMDALFLEAQMIKRYMPKWNIDLRDDKNVSYVRIDMKSPAPYVSFTRNPIDDGADYYGPYFGTKGIKAALRALRRVFPFYDKPFDGRKTLYTDLKLTPGIEVGYTTAKEYKHNLKNLIQYIKGNRQKLMKELEQEMKKASDSGNFEQAAIYRNQLFGLKELATKIIFSDKEFLDISSDQALSELQKLLNLSEPPKRIEGYDISHQSGTNVVGSMVVFINGVADRTKYRKFKLRNQRNDDPANMREIITRRLRHLDDWGRPDLVIIDGGELQLNAVADLLNAESIPFVGRDKSGNHSKNAIAKIMLGDMRRETGGIGALSSCDSNASDEPGNDPREERRQGLLVSSHVEKLLQRIDDEAHRFAITYHTLLKRKNQLR